MTTPIQPAFAFALVCALAFTAESSAASRDWPQFRGTGAWGTSDAKSAPLNWSDDKGIVWKTALPGPGASSPITLGDKIFLTSFTGFATSSREPGDMANLKRHLLCLNLADGKILWDTATPADLPEQDRIRENHG